MPPGGLPPTRTRPIGITYQGGVGLVDPVERAQRLPDRADRSWDGFSLRRVPDPQGPQDRPRRRRLVLRARRLEGLGESFAGNAELGRDQAHRPGRCPDLAPEVLRARRAGATALLVWAEPTTIAGVIAAARGSGWNVPIYTPASGEDPLVRQQLANHPEWVDGLTFAAGRPTAEVGAARFSSSSATTNRASECSSWA